MKYTRTHTIKTSGQENYSVYGEWSVSWEQTGKNKCPWASWYMSITRWRWFCVCFTVQTCNPPHVIVIQTWFVWHWHQVFLITNTSCLTGYRPMLSERSGAVWKSWWPSWAPNSPYGLCGHKATLNLKHVVTCIPDYKYLVVWRTTDLCYHRCKVLLITNTWLSDRLQIWQTTDLCYHRPCITDYKYLIICQTTDLHWPLLQTPGFLDYTDMYHFTNYKGAVWSVTPGFPTCK